MKQYKTIFLYLLLLLLALIMLFPLVWLLGTSLKPASEDVFASSIWPNSPTFKNFFKVWTSYPFDKYLLNSSMISVLTVVLNLLFCSLAAYPLARLNFWGKEIIFAMIIATLMIPFQIIMIPLYILTIELGLKNTIAGVIFPSLASAFGIFLLRQSFAGVPKELEEAARMDGCSELDLWWSVMLPAIRPSLTTLALFVFIGSWGDFLWPLIVLEDESVYTVPLGVAKLSSSLDLDWRLVAAGSVISLLPVLLIFLVLQRYLVPSNLSSGIKG
jgi:putative chitobiose transport system permease protein